MIYADYNGSAPLHPHVREYLLDRLENGVFANPNSIHVLGQKVMAAIEESRRLCAKELGAKSSQVIFNSGSTEGISHIFYSLLDCQAEKKQTIVISSIEHSAIVNMAQHFCEHKGHQLEVVPCDENGVVKTNFLKDLLEDKTKNIALVSIMAANNETGVVQPYQELSKLCREHQVPFACDTTQLIGKDHFNFEESGIDYAFMSGHKIGALIGSGLLLAKNPTELRPLIIGGGQERNKRGGTQNYIGIETLAVALKAFSEEKNKLKQVKKNRDAFEKELKSLFPQTVIMGEKANRLSGTSMLSLPGVHGQAVQIELESQDVFVTTSSACSDNEPNTSKVLRGMGITDDIGRGVIRISVGHGNEGKEFQKILPFLKQAYEKLAKIKSY